MQKTGKSPVSGDALYRELMGIYAALLRQGIAPRQVDETELEDLFTMLEGMENTSGTQSRRESYIDDIMG